MLVLQISAKPAYTIINLDHFSSIVYSEEHGKLLFVFSDSSRRIFYVDKGTPEVDIFDAIKMSLSPIYEPRSLQTHGVQLMLNLLKFQTGAETVFE
jgi:hypothetical protein